MTHKFDSGIHDLSVCNKKIVSIVTFSLYIKDLFIKNRTIHSSKTLLSVVRFFINKSLIYLYLPNKSYSDIPADGVKMRLPKQSD